MPASKINYPAALIGFVIIISLILTACGDATKPFNSDAVATEAARAADTARAASLATPVVMATLTSTPATPASSAKLPPTITVASTIGLDDKGQPVNCLTPPVPPATSKSTSTDNQLVIKGSDTMVVLAEHWAREYQTRNAGKTVVVFGGGSQTGLDAFMMRQTDIAESSRKMKDSEKQAAKDAGLNPVETVVALDGVAVAVNPTNPIESLSIEQLSGIYAGKITNWKEVGGPDAPITVLSRNGESGTNSFFKENVLQKGDSKAAIYWGSNVICLPSSQDEQNQIAINPNAIGYFGLGYVRPNVKALKIRKDATATPVLPSVETVQNGSYPLSRQLQFYTNGTPQGLARSFIDFVLSEDGQKIVADEEFVRVSGK